MPAVAHVGYSIVPWRWRDKNATKTGITDLDAAGASG